MPPSRFPQRKIGSGAKPTVLPSRQLSSSEHSSAETPNPQRVSTTASDSTSYQPLASLETSNPQRASNTESELTSYQPLASLAPSKAETRNPQLASITVSESTSNQQLASLSSSKEETFHQQLASTVVSGSTSNPQLASPALSACQSLDTALPTKLPASSLVCMRAVLHRHNLCRQHEMHLLNPSLPPCRFVHSEELYDTAVLLCLVQLQDSPAYKRGLNRSYFGTPLTFK
jgi:hypothetical protein